MSYFEGSRAINANRRECHVNITASHAVLLHANRAMLRGCIIDGVEWSVIDLTDRGQRTMSYVTGAE